MAGRSFLCFISHLSGVIYQVAVVWDVIIGQVVLFSGLGGRKGYLLCVILWGNNNFL